MRRAAASAHGCAPTPSTRPDSNFSDDVSAAVGIDGALTTTAELRAGGAIYVAEPAALRAPDHLQAGASFQSNGPLTMLSSNADLLADAYVNGAISGSVKVSGTLHVPATATSVRMCRPTAMSPAPYRSTAPCDCSSGFVDVAGAMRAATTPTATPPPASPPTPWRLTRHSAQLDLGCGTYF